MDTKFIKYNIAMQNLLVFVRSQTTSSYWRDFFRMERGKVTSGVSQGSALGPLFFVIFISDLPERFVNSSRLYADDSKIISVISNLEEALSLQTDIDALTEWTRDWLMRLNAGKCKVMYFCESNFSRIEYTMNDLVSGCRIPLESQCCERDIGDKICSDLK